MADIGWLRRSKAYQWNGGSTAADYAYTASAMREAVELMKATPEWISVKDRLPERRKGKHNDIAPCLCYRPICGTVDIAYYSDTLDKWFCRGLEAKVTHWMPLPDPPKDGITHEKD